MHPYHLVLVAALLTGCSATQIGNAIDAAAVSVAGGANTYSDNDISVNVPAGYTLAKNPLQNEPSLLFIAQDATNQKRLSLQTLDVSKYVTPIPESMTINDAPGFLGASADNFVRSAGGTDATVVAPARGVIVGGKTAFAMSFTYRTQGQTVMVFHSAIYKKPMMYVVDCVDLAGVGDAPLLEQVLTSLTFKH